MASPSGQKITNPKTIRAMVKGPHCGLINVAFIGVFSQSRTSVMWRHRARDQANACPILPLESAENDSHAAPKSGSKARNLDEFEHGKPRAAARQLAPAAPRHPRRPALAGGDRPEHRRAVHRLGA